MTRFDRAWVYKCYCVNVNVNVNVSSMCKN